MAYVIETQFLAEDQMTSVIGSMNKNINQMGNTLVFAGRQSKAAGGSFKQMALAMGAGSIAAQAFHGILRKLKTSIVGIAMHAGRVEELTIVLEQVGKTAGYSASTMGHFTTVMKKLGIETDVAQAGLVRMIQAQLNLTDAMKLARVAQDAAVVSGTNSSEALNRMIHGIVTLRPIVLRQMGIMVSLEDEYAKFAETTGRTVESLSGQEKQQLALNAVLREGEKLTGAYEAAMTSASKQLRSTPRYTKLMMEAMSDAALPAFREIVLDLNTALKDLTVYMENNQEALTSLGAGLGATIKLVFQLVRGLEQAAYWMGLSPRNVGEMTKSYNDWSKSVTVLLRWLGGVSQEQLKQEHIMGKLNAVIADNKKAIDSLLAAEDLKLRAEILNLQHDFKKGLIDEIKFREEIKRLVEALAISEANLAEKRKQAQIEEKKRQRDIMAMRKKLTKEIKKLSMQDVEYAKSATKEQAQTYMDLVGESEEAAKDREQIAKWLQLTLADIEKEGANKRKTIIQKMRDSITRLTQGAAAEQKIQLQRELDNAKKAGVDRLLIEQYQQEKLAEIRREMPTREEFEVQLTAEIATDDQMAKLQQEHLERREVIKQHYNDLLEDAKQFEDSKEQIQRVYNAREMALASEQVNYLQAQARMKTENTLESLRLMQSGMDALYTSGLAKNKVMFYAMKAMAISEAIISANLAAAKTVGQTGIFGLPMSSMIYASAMMRVAAIAAQQPGFAEGGVVYPRGSGGQSVTVAEKGPEAIVPLSRGRAIPVEMNGGQQPIMNITIQAIDTQSGMDFLMKNKSTIGNAMMGASADNHPVRRR